VTPCIGSTALEVVLIAQDLIAWTQGLCLTGKLAKAEPKALRTGMLTKGQVDPESLRRFGWMLSARRQTPSQND